MSFGMGWEEKENCWLHVNLLWHFNVVRGVFLLFLTSPFLRFSFWGEWNYYKLILHSKQKQKNQNQIKRKHIWFHLLQSFLLTPFFLRFQNSMQSKCWMDGKVDFKSKLDFRMKSNLLFGKIQIQNHFELIYYSVFIGISILDRFITGFSRCFLIKYLDMDALVRSR